MVRAQDPPCLDHNTAHGYRICGPARVHASTPSLGQRRDIIPLMPAARANSTAVQQRSTATTMTATNRDESSVAD
jgi:hypothetical protein